MLQACSSQELIDHKLITATADLLGVRWHTLKRACLDRIKFDERIEDELTDGTDSEVQTHWIVVQNGVPREKESHFGSAESYSTESYCGSTESYSTESYCGSTESYNTESYSTCTKSYSGSTESMTESSNSSNSPQCFLNL